MSMGWNSLRIQNMLFGLLAAALLQAVMHPSWFWLCFFNGIVLDSFFSLEGGLSFITLPTQGMGLQVSTGGDSYCHDEKTKRT